MTIRQQYQKARRNYLRRVKRLTNQGYFVKPIALVKRPTRASIARLEKETGKAIKQHASTTLYDVLTGEAVQVKGRKHRQRVQKMNQEFMQMTPFEQETVRELQSVSTISFSGSNKSLREITQRAFDNMDEVQEYDIIIDRWYEFIETGIHPRVRMLVRQSTDELLGRATEAEKIAFARVRKRNPDIFPDGADSRDEVVNAKMTEVAESMGWVMNSDEFRQIIDLMDVVIEPEE